MLKHILTLLMTGTLAGSWRVAAEVAMWADLEATSAVSMECIFEVG
jgi:hypothetical protein